MSLIQGEDSSDYLCRSIEKVKYNKMQNLSHRLLLCSGSRVSL